MTYNVFSGTLNPTQSISLRLAINVTRRPGISWCQRTVTATALSSRLSVGSIRWLVNHSRRRRGGTITGSVAVSSGSVQLQSPARVHGVEQVLGVDGDHVRRLQHLAPVVGVQQRLTVLECQLHGADQWRHVRRQHAHRHLHLRATAAASPSGRLLHCMRLKNRPTFVLL